jgi:hypothetical protein
MRQLKKYLRKYRVYLGISANYTQGNQIQLRCQNPVSHDRDTWLAPGISEMTYRLSQPNMELLKKAYKIHECINNLRKGDSNETRYSL